MFFPTGCVARATLVRLRGRECNGRATLVGEMFMKKLMILLVEWLLHHRVHVLNLLSGENALLSVYRSHSLLENGDKNFRSMRAKG